MWIYESNLSCDNFISGDSPYSKKYLAELSAEYDELKDSHIFELSLSAFQEYFKSGNRLLYEREYFRRRIMLRDFALKAWLGDDEALPRLENVMRAVCDELTWALPAHIRDYKVYGVIDLFAAETAQALVEIASLLKEKLSPGIVRKCIGEARRRILNPFINRKEKYNWENMQSNWCAVCGGCVGMTAVYIIEDIQELKRVTQSLTDTFISYFESFTEDGGCLEGLYYWNYGMMYLTAFLDLYKQRTGEDFPINTAKMIKMANFSHKCCLTNGITVSFSDSGESDRIYSGLSSRLEELYGARSVKEAYKAYFAGDECGRWCKAARDMAWTCRNIPEPLEKISILPAAQWAVMRGENTAAAFKGGSNGEPHNHNDVGSFIAVKNGNVILCDIGAGEYTREYFSDSRYNIFCTRSMGHSVPVINGAEQKTGTEYAAKAFEVYENGASLDISGAYGIKELKSCVRSIELRGDKFKITDSFYTDAPITVMERFITRNKAEISGDGVHIISGDNCIARLISTFGQSKINTARHNEHNGNISEITIIDFVFKAEKSMVFSLEII